MCKFRRLRQKLFPPSEREGGGGGGTVKHRKITRRSSCRINIHLALIRRRKLSVFSVARANAFYENVKLLFGGWEREEEGGKVFGSRKFALFHRGGSESCRMGRRRKARAFERDGS